MGSLTSRLATSLMVQFNRQNTLTTYISTFIIHDSCNQAYLDQPLDNLTSVHRLQTMVLVPIWQQLHPLFKLSEP